MITQFKTLFTVTITHAYYLGRCEDFAFVIPADTAKRLRNGKLLAREREGRLHVLFEADDTGAALKPISGQTLRIGLRLLNPSFSNFTKDDDNSFASSTRLYRNTADTLDAPKKIHLVGQVLSHLLTSTARPVAVKLRDSSGLVLQAETINDAIDPPSVSYDLTGQAPGAYSIEEAYPNGTITNSYYSDPELMQTGVLGLIEVKIESGFYPSDPDVPAPNFQIDFEARLETLNYYVVAHNYTDADLKQLSVSDAGSADDEQPPINFTKISSDSFTGTEIPPALLTNSSAQVVLFRSLTAVARREKARKKIQLKKNGTLLVAHLPQPGPERPNADLIIPVSKP
jgi:hypothetical protein